jgi:DNA-binding NtrC family response regulator
MERKLEVLLVDDEDIVCKRLKWALEKYGYQVEVFQEGKAAIERMTEKEFDIIVSDIRIDEIDGLEILEASRKSARRPKTILITGYATSELAREALLKGAYEFIAKPFKPKDLHKVIQRASRETDFYVEK